MNLTDKASLSVVPETGDLLVDDGGRNRPRGRDHFATDTGNNWPSGV